MAMYEIQVTITKTYHIEADTAEHAEETVVCESNGILEADLNEFVINYIKLI